jgi:hypothetical protein
LAEVEEVDFEQEAGFGAFDSGADAEIGDAALEGSVGHFGFDGVDAFGWEFLVEDFEVGCGESDGAAELAALDDLAEDGVFAAEEALGSGEVAGLNGGANAGAADDFVLVAVDGFDAVDGESMECAFCPEEITVALAVLAEAPVAADADFGERLGGGDELIDEVVGAALGELLIECLHEQVLNAKRL